jgi:hypothetical protein
MSRTRKFLGVVFLVVVCFSLSAFAASRLSNHGPTSYGDQPSALCMFEHFHFREVPRPVKLNIPSLPISIDLCETVSL